MEAGAGVEVAVGEVDEAQSARFSNPLAGANVVPKVGHLLGSEMSLERDRGSVISVPSNRSRHMLGARHPPSVFQCRKP